MKAKKKRTESIKRIDGVVCLLRQRSCKQLITHNKENSTSLLQSNQMNLTFWFIWWKKKEEWFDEERRRKRKETSKNQRFLWGAAPAGVHLLISWNKFIPSTNSLRFRSSQIKTFICWLIHSHCSINWMFDLIYSCDLLISEWSKNKNKVREDEKR